MLNRLCRGITEVGRLCVAFACLASGLNAQVIGPTTPKGKGVYVESVTLTQVSDRVGPGLNVGAVVSDSAFAKGLQKAADVWGLTLDLFVTSDSSERTRLVDYFIDVGESLVVVDGRTRENWSKASIRAKQNVTTLSVVNPVAAASFDGGFATGRLAYTSLQSRIPKYDEVFAIAFPISPVPGSFFQKSKFPYPSPVVRAERTSESESSSAHAHTSCNMFAQTGNMLHRTSSRDPNLFLMGMEGGNLALKAQPGAADAAKMSAKMTSWVIAIRGAASEKRDILVENDAVESSFFKPGLHSPEEMTIALDAWKAQGIISGYRQVDAETIRLDQLQGKTRDFRAGMFLIQSARSVASPELILGHDANGRLTLEFLSTQQFIQQLAEIPDSLGQFRSVPQSPAGGIITKAGATVGNTVGAQVSSLLTRLRTPAGHFQPYLLSIEGGFFVVTPEGTLTQRQMSERVRRIDIEFRGPLTSDQSIVITLESGEKILFRRTVFDFEQLDRAIGQLHDEGFLGDWKYDGVRGQGLDANVVFENYLGKNRKFMSSAMVWPTEERPSRPLIRFYVDGMQRLNFTLITTDGWRQEFVEVPLRMPPVPRDMELYSHVSTLP